MSGAAAAMEERVDARSPADAVRAILAVPEAELDYARAKLALDEVVDPSLDREAAMAELDRLAAQARLMAGPDADSACKLGALRTLLYESGPWNGYRPFGYDHSDPEGTRIENKLLANYLRTRLGNCLSMPILMLVLGDRLGLKTSLSTAPRHVFLRVEDESGRVFNVEATSGGHPARDEWYRHNFPMSDRALASGLYMRTHSRRETVGVMVETLLAYLSLEGRWNDAAAAAKVVLEHDPRSCFAPIVEASAYGRLADDFRADHPIEWLVPAHLRLRYLMLVKRNRGLLDAAEELGWEPPECDEAGAAGSGEKEKKGLQSC